MSNLIVPATKSTGRRPTLTEYVESYLTRMRAPLKESVQFGPAGRAVIHSKGERIIYGPKGQKIRILDDVSGTIVQHGNERGRGVEHQHVHVRPDVVTVGFGQLGGDPDELIKAQERQRARSSRRIIIPRGR